MKPVESEEVTPLPIILIVLSCYVVKKKKGGKKQQKHKHKNAAPKFRCCGYAGGNCEVKTAVFYEILFGMALFLIRTNDQLF